jgi:hypothetical protein
MIAKSGIIVITAWKAAIVIGSGIGVWLYALNPNIAIALIVSFPGIVTAILAVLTRRDNMRKSRRDDEQHAATMGVLDKVSKQTDGMLTGLTRTKDEQAVQLSETAQKLAHVEGHEEGRQAGVASEINREPPETTKEK